MPVRIRLYDGQDARRGSDAPHDATVMCDRLEIHFGPSRSHGRITELDARSLETGWANRFHYTYGLWYRATADSSMLPISCLRRAKLNSQKLRGRSEGIEEPGTRRVARGPQIAAADSRPAGWPFPYSAELCISSRTSRNAPAANAIATAMVATNHLASNPLPGWATGVASSCRSAMGRAGVRSASITPSASEAFACVTAARISRDAGRRTGGGRRGGGRAEVALEQEVGILRRSGRGSVDATASSEPTSIPPKSSHHPTLRGQHSRSPIRRQLDVRPRSCRFDATALVARPDCLGTGGPRQFDRLHGIDLRNRSIRAARSGSTAIVAPSVDQGRGPSRGRWYRLEVDGAMLGSASRVTSPVAGARHSPRATDRLQRRALIIRDPGEKPRPPPSWRQPTETGPRAPFAMARDECGEIAGKLRTAGLDRHRRRAPKPHQQVRDVFGPNGRRRVSTS